MIEHILCPLPYNFCVGVGIQWAAGPDSRGSPSGVLAPPAGQMGGKVRVCQSLQKEMEDKSNR